MGCRWVAAVLFTTYIVLACLVMFQCNFLSNQADQLGYGILRGEVWRKV